MSSGDKLIDLLNAIDDAKCELEELNECGTLEERLEVSLRIEELKAQHFRAKMAETDPEYMGDGQHVCLALMLSPRGASFIGTLILSS